ncbi:hypothetical protein Bealeia1_00298 [Candidatus Bealeia paramacronuclearis]|uniref:Uncharacterized protein n=1 Tax=Candidatus Bealeia paramacronuclearis TaxID=1921001 RepID=A0ABZ2C2W9_9PROT|nr:hypothetical protein [Candidatus Bealeia paramacronuclearis]
MKKGFILVSVLTYSVLCAPEDLEAGKKGRHSHKETMPPQTTPRKLSQELPNQTIPKAPPPPPDFSTALVVKKETSTLENKNEKKKKGAFKIVQGGQDLIKHGKKIFKEITSGKPGILFEIPHDILSKVILKKVDINVLPQVIGGNKPPSQSASLISQIMGTHAVEELKKKSESTQERRRYLEWVKSESQKPERQELFSELQDVVKMKALEKESQELKAEKERLEKLVQEKKLQENAQKKKGWKLWPFQ